MDAEQQRRAARREFIRAHHPDHGGDPAEFAAGLARLDSEPTRPPADGPNLVEFEDQPWPRSFVSVLLSRLRRRRD